MKGIVLAGGTGSRLWPTTLIISKQLLPIYDKPTIFYPLSVLMNMGIKEILVITTPQDLSQYKSLLGEGKHLGIKIEYAIQERPEGIGQAFTIAKSFIGNSSVCLILGDNIFWGFDFKYYANKMSVEEAYIFTFMVSDPQRYGVLEIDDEDSLISIQEKPAIPKSNLAITGIYMFDSSVARESVSVKKSSRGEYEITDILNNYLRKNKLKNVTMPPTSSWLDTGTPESLLEASLFIKLHEERTGLKIACLEEIALKNGWINSEELLNIAAKMPSCAYKDYLIKVIRDQT